jgi:tetratricopeptide (TPR) repeat protein
VHFPATAQEKALIRLSLHSTVDTIHRVLDSTWLRRYYQIGDSMTYIVIENVCEEPVTLSHDMSATYEEDDGNLFFRTWYADGDSLKAYNYHHWDIGYVLDPLYPQPDRVLQPGAQVVIYEPVFSMHGNMPNRWHRAQVVYRTKVNGKAEEFVAEYIDVYFSGPGDTLSMVSIDSLVRKAEAAEQQGDCYQAIDYYRELSSRRAPGGKMNEWLTFPFHLRRAQWQYKIGVCAMKLKHYEAAYWALQEAVSSDTSNISYQALLAEAYFGAGLYEDAAKAYERATQLSARTGTLNGDYVRLAEQSWQKEEEAIMNDPKRLIELAGKYAQAQNHHIAIRLYNRAEELEGQGFRHFDERARSYITIGRYNDALNDITRAIKWLPGVPHFYVIRAEVYLAKGRWPNACRDLEYAALLADKDYQQREIAEMKRKYCDNK